jgi:hypothetical protein
MISRKVMLPMAAVALVGAGAVGIQVTQAAGSSTGKNQSLVQDIASTFSLDPAKVQAVFNAHAKDQASARQTRYEDMLQKAVIDGKLTSSQMSAVLTEHNTLVSQLQAAKAQTGTARSTALKAVYQDANTWAKQNSISPRWLLGPRHLRDAGPFVTPNTTPSPTPSS